MPVVAWMVRRRLGAGRRSVVVEWWVVIGIAGRRVDDHFLDVVTEIRREVREEVRL